MTTFNDWSPAQLAFTLGYRINLVALGNGAREPYLIGPAGKSHRTTHARACHALARLARWHGVDPTRPPAETPRALVNGKEQAGASELQRRLARLMAAAPLRSKGKPIEDAAHLPLFVAANEPSLPL